MQKLLIPVSYIEGISLLILLFIAMPLKYLAGDPSLVRIVGMTHGILFMILVSMIAVIGSSEAWPKKLVWFALISSALPFGMFAFDKKLRVHYKPDITAP